MLMIERKRKVNGWTQTELAAKAKMSYQDISRIENGWLKPYNGMALRLSEVLGIEPEELTKEAK